MTWHFAIDAGGTFTDVVARLPDGRCRVLKLLGTGVVRGRAGSGSTPQLIRDAHRQADPPGFWVGYGVRLASESAPENSSASFGSAPVRATRLHRAARDQARGSFGSSDRRHIPISRVVAFDHVTGTMEIDPPREAIRDGSAYELFSGEPSPVLAIRYLMGLSLTDPIEGVDVSLGTTRATNALLERKGARVALLTTAGFGDLFRIGNQDRPELFKLDIQKRAELAVSTVELEERLDAHGRVLQTLSRDAVIARLAALLGGSAEDSAGAVGALAVCLLHAHRNPVHEELVAQIAAELGFESVSVSSRLSRLEKFVPRLDTTLVDAYVGTVIGEYVRRMEQSQGGRKIWLMSSHGGLARSDHASAKDTILSGPAGGIVGCARLAKALGLDKIITFDMGGTSTDVARYDGTLEYTHETVKAGARLMTPMLAIETIAAGGGSLCVFDGQRLSVGPASAGADPGPACYGRGGPLTLTDVNVVLGRIPLSRFPFTLDAAAARALLESLADQVRATTGTPMTVEELGEGLIRIANEAMAGAIRTISIARGYDPREYALIAFGGAGGQHACALARALGIRTIVHSPFAGVLSALGIEAAPVKRILEQSVNVPLDGEAGAVLRSVFDELTAQAREALVADDVDPHTIRDPVWTMDLCYVGQSSFLTIPAEFASTRREFESLYGQLFGYIHENRAVEIRTARVEIAADPGGSEPWQIHSLEGAPQSRAGHCSESYESQVAENLAKCPGARHAGRMFAKGNAATDNDIETTSMWLDGAFRDVPLYLRSDLQPGAQLAGPAIVAESSSTFVVEPGWIGMVSPTGDLILTDMEGEAPRARPEAKANPVELELFTRRFAAIAEQMGYTLRRTALSVNVKERLDYSCAVFTGDGDLVANAPHIPVHLGAMSECVKALIEDMPDMHAGDSYVTNDPYRGGSHLNDVTVITPVFDDTGRRRLFFTASRAHHAEIGGTRPGSMPPNSKTLAEEGVVIHAFPLIRNGQADYEGLRALLTQGLHPSRAPQENLADVAAQVAANHRGAQDLLNMARRYGAETVLSFMRYINDAAAAKMRGALSKVPPGCHRFEDFMDDGSRIRLELTVGAEGAVFDFSGTAPVVEGNLNANRAIVTSAVMYCLRCLLDEDIPLNSGVLEPIEIRLPTCFLNPPRHVNPSQSPAVAGGNVETSQRIVDVIFGALRLAAASQGTMNNLLLGNERFSYYETICGGAGAGPGFHGADAVQTHMTNTRLTDPEVLEARYPLRIVRFCIHRGSGGAGRWQGGCGVIRELEILEPLDLSIISQRRTIAPYGLEGGASGQPGRNLLRRAGGTAFEELPGVASAALHPGDCIRIETPGGGGFGSPS